jgi:probable rRNA maturation factor
VGEAAAAGWTLHLNRPDGGLLPSQKLRQGVALVLEEEGVQDGELSITFLEDDPIRELNRRYLNHDWVPDVLSFPLHQDGYPLHGDIYVGLGQAARQATEHGVPLEEELVRLSVHGVLHVLGYDHPEDMASRRASSLYRIQERVVRKVFSGDGLTGGDPR